MLIIPDPQIDFQIPNLWQRLCIYTYGTPVAPVGGGQFSSLNALLFRFSEIIRLWSISKRNFSIDFHGAPMMKLVSYLVHIWSTLSHISSLTAKSDRAIITAEL